MGYIDLIFQVFCGFIDMGESMPMRARDVQHQGMEKLRTVASLRIGTYANYAHSFLPQICIILANLQSEPVIHASSALDTTPISK